MTLPSNYKQQPESKEPSVSFDFKFSEKQQEIYDWCKIGNGIQYVVVSTGRQVGKTLTDSAVSISWSLAHSNFKTGFFLPTYKQCKKVFNGVKRMLTPLHKYIEFNKTDYTITFWNGSIIQFFTADNDNCRGFTFDAIIVDEACFVKNDIWEEAIEPTVAASLSKVNKLGQVGFCGKVLLTSTPKTKNWFYGMVNTEDDRTVVTRFTSEDGGIIHKSILERIKKRIPEAAYKNEYLGEFLDSGNGLFKYLDCLIPLKEYANLPKLGHIAAVDVASKDDYLVLTIQDKQGRVIFVGRWRHQEYDIMMASVAEKLKEYGSPLCYVETNGVGQAPFEQLRKLYSRTVEWTTTSSNKADIIINLQIDFNTGNVKIPNIEFIKDELDYFTCEWVNGRPVYGGSNGFHDDCVMSLAICNYNRKNVKKFDIEIFKTQQKSNY